MARKILMSAEVDVEAPPELSNQEVAEATLQGLAAWCANAPGLRARALRVDVNGVAVKYNHTVDYPNAEPRGAVALKEA